VRTAVSQVKWVGRAAGIAAGISAGVAAALLVVGGGSAAISAVPTIYVSYTGCQFTMTNDAGGSITSGSSIPYGSYQIQVSTPGSYSGTPVTCSAQSVDHIGFQLTGPGVSATTSLQEGDASTQTLGPYTFSANSSYTATDTVVPNPTTINFTTNGTAVTAPIGGSGTTSTTTSGGTTTIVTTTTTATTTPSTSPAPPPGYVGVDIDGGAFATDSRSVELDLVWPTGATSALISNNGGFDTAGSTETVALAPEVPWTLEYTGSDRLPKTVYVRYLGASIDTENFTDDIILDEETPSIIGATLLPPSAARSTQAVTAGAGSSTRSYRVRVLAAENLSGISDVESSVQPKSGLVTTLARAGRQGFLKLDKIITVTGRAAPRYARVRSAAGKWSRWLAITPQH
jgi:hypothetical protein